MPQPLEHPNSSHYIVDTVGSSLVLLAWFQRKGNQTKLFRYESVLVILPFGGDCISDLKSTSVNIEHSIIVGQHVFFIDLLRIE